MKRRWRQELRRELAFPKSTRAFSSIPFIRSGSGSPASSPSSPMRSSAVRAARIGRACFSAKASSKNVLARQISKQLNNRRNRDNYFTTSLTADNAIFVERLVAHFSNDKINKKIYNNHLRKKQLPECFGSILYLIEAKILAKYSGS